jgi:hypothetical protein
VSACANTLTVVAQARRNQKSNLECLRETWHACSLVALHCCTVVVNRGLTWRSEITSPGTLAGNGPPPSPAASPLGDVVDYIRQSERWQCDHTVGRVSSRAQTRHQEVTAASGALVLVVIGWPQRRYHCAVNWPQFFSGGRQGFCCGHAGECHCHWRDFEIAR